MNLTSVLLNVAAAEQEQQQLQPQQQNCYLGTRYITDQFGSCNISSAGSLVSWDEGNDRLTSQNRDIHAVGSASQSSSPWYLFNGCIRNNESANSSTSRKMPRAKRRATSTANNLAQADAAQNVPEDNPRHPAKRSRHASSNWRRNSKQEDVNLNVSYQNFSSKRCIAWFREYATPEDPDMLGPEGMEKFCEDLEVEPENVVMLVLAYKMGARCMGYFSLNEWLKGLDELQCDSMVKLKNKLDFLRGVLNDSQVFKAIYRYAYDFARQDKDQRSMDMETARIMLQLLLGKNWTLFPHFGKFLDQSKYRVINKDQWCNILEFSRSIHQDLSNYDLDGAWPVMLDEFVEWLKAQREDEDRNRMDNS